MTRIGIDARLINQTGVGVYTRNLLRNLEKMIFQFQIYVYLRKEDAKKIQFQNKLFVKKIADYHWHSFDEQYKFLNQLAKDNLDLMHFTYFSYPILYKRNFVITIHDLIPLTHSTGRASTLNPFLYGLKQFGYKIALKSGVQNSRTIITPTETVKNALTKHFGPSVKSKIQVTYEGFNEELLQAKENQDLSDKFPHPFFIYVGNFYPHKNVEKLIEAFRSVNNNYSLILVGPQDYFAHRLRERATQSDADRVIFYHNPSLADFVYLYKHAAALIHPSLDEGFGLPLIEASYFSCPIIASNIPVFKEILGDNYLSFNPRSTSSIADSINSFTAQLNNKAMQNYFMPKSHISNTFTFRKMSAQTLRIYQASL